MYAAVIERLIPCLLVWSAFGQSEVESTAPCIDHNKFYRNPKTPSHRVWATTECAKYYLCLDDEVFEFKCSQGLLFDVSRQICDFKGNVDNCDIALEEQPPKPLLDKGHCDKGNLACGDETCLPATYFCDGSVDCPDGSDEGWCDVTNDPNAAGICVPEKCKVPDCWCSKDGTKIPGNLSVNLIPQMVLITFEDAVNAENFNLYTELFTDDKKNPNGCPIRATFFVSHQYTNYRDVQFLWNAGHEIAAHSVTHRGPEEWWSQNATIEDWFDEMVGVANIINKYSGVRMEDIKGLRVPFLRLGWNRQFLMMTEFGFEYDTSMVAPFSDPPIWPYTMDYRPPHKCVGLGQICPSRSYPGIWEIPLNPLLVHEFTCPTVDSCPANLSGEDVYKMFMHNFERHYRTNRAPFGLHFHAAWFQNPAYRYAFGKFIEDILRLPEVYFVTNHQAIEWIRNPTTIENLHKFEAWSCADRRFEPRELACDLPSACKLPSRVLKTDRYLHTCFECPKQYPWLRNEFGLD
ncbi:uncharacterized protein LOC107266605 isoform X2 [Cephus cinctus]|uniref:Uncharacterized protein LOC107266605 isoform X2 n=1 Tax=Cephus cinctus TaxID=211228 RepID=A0AAJ7FHZ7_CEPCN|nr:uncharacterized protein LOC107266605 isoform X2 [Cephus cinctus]